MQKYHLAQINIAKAKADMESPVMEGFVSRLDEINHLAEQSSGFVWRLTLDAGEPTGIQEYDATNIIVNMSVWEDLASLKHFVYKTAHVELIRDRSAWFNQMIESQVACWWVPVGCIPSIKEGKDILEILERNGPSHEAFTFAKPFPMPEN